jgi:hypothetical protein
VIGIASAFPEPAIVKVPAAQPRPDRVTFSVTRIALRDEDNVRDLTDRGVREARCREASRTRDDSCS